MKEEISQDQVSQIEGPAQRWWNHPRLPLCPIYRYRRPGDWNTASYNLHWLIFRMWTSDAPMLGFSVDISDEQLQIRINLPYLLTGLFIPIFPYSSHRFWRKPKRMKEVWK